MTSANPIDYAAPRPPRRHAIRHLRDFILEGVLVLLCIVLAIKAPGFTRRNNLLHILSNASMEGVIAFGMTMVIIAGEIDLSVGSAVGFAGCVIAWCTQYFTDRGWPMPAAILTAFFIALAAGALAGCISGILRVRFRVPTFISTLAWMTALRGLAGLITSGFPITPFPDWYSFFFAGTVNWHGFSTSGNAPGIPFPAIVFLAVFALIHFVMNFTTFGRAVYAVGGNAEAARLSGINVAGVKIGVMAIVASLAVLASVMESSRIMAGRDTDAAGWELDVIAAVIIGGTSLMGGAGRVWGTFIGIIFLGVLVNGMTLLNINEYWQMVVRGVLILTAVLVNSTTGEGNDWTG